MRRRMGFLSAGLGAGLVYFLDPPLGGIGGALLRGKVAHGVRSAGTWVEKAGRDALHRLRGLARGAPARFLGNGASDDAVLERVRATIGRVVRHPGAIEVRVEDGRAILTGPVLADKVGGFLKKVRSVKGVKDVENGLKVYEEPGDVPALQARLPRRKELPELAQATWTPAIRFLAGAAGTGFIWYARRAVSAGRWPVWEARASWPGPRPTARSTTWSASGRARGS